MRFIEFRNDPSLVGQWQEMLKGHGLLKLVVEVLENEHPTRFMVPLDENNDVSPTMASIALGETRGYSKCLNGLKLLAVAASKPKELPETEYAPEEPETPETQLVTPQPKRRGRPPKQK